MISTLGLDNCLVLEQACPHGVYPQEEGWEEQVQDAARPGKIMVYTVKGVNLVIPLFSNSYDKDLIEGLTKKRWLKKIFFLNNKDLNEVLTKTSWQIKFS